MTSILMVCLGNICRSPLAQGIMQSKLNPNTYYVDSAGTSNYHIGDPPDQRSIKVGRENGIDISAQMGRQFKVMDFDDFDHIFVMDESNYENILALARTKADEQKVKLILNTNEDTSNHTVPDPYHGEYSDFKNVYSLLDKACEYWAKRL